MVDLRFPQFTVTSSYPLQSRALIFTSLPFLVLEHIVLNKNATSPFREGRVPLFHHLSAANIKALIRFRVYRNQSCHWLSGRIQKLEPDHNKELSGYEKLGKNLYNFTPWPYTSY
jgi:hypothetical protein